MILSCAVYTFVRPTRPCSKLVSFISAGSLTACAVWCHKSSLSTILFGVPQGSSEPYPILAVYSRPFSSCQQSWTSGTFIYADDTQLYGACCPARTTDLQTRLSVCVDGVASWMSANRLQLNAAKTELLWCGSSRRIAQPRSDLVMVCGSDIQPVSVVRDLGMWIDGGVTASTHTSKVVAGCFAILRELHSTYRSLTQATLIRLVVSLVLTRMDYCNSVLTGLPLLHLSSHR